MVFVEGQPETSSLLQSQPITLTQQKKQFKVSECEKTASHINSPRTLTVRKSPTYTVPLVGKKSLLNCFISGYATTVLFDSGSQVSIINRTWKKTFIPNHPVRLLEELLDSGESLNLCAVNGQSIPYDGWVELTVNLLGNDNPSLTMQVPFLVSQLPISQPLLGADVLQEMINSQISAADAQEMLISLLRKAFGVGGEQADAMVSLIQTKEPKGCRMATIRVKKRQCHHSTWEDNICAM